MKRLFVPHNTFHSAKQAGGPKFVELRSGSKGETWTLLRDLRPIPEARSYARICCSVRIDEEVRKKDSRADTGTGKTEMKRKPEKKIPA